MNNPLYVLSVVLVVATAAVFVLFAGTLSNLLLNLIIEAATIEIALNF